MKRAAAVFFFFLFFYMLACGGHIVSSDGNTMFLLTASIVENGSISVPYGNAFPGHDGRLYPKAGIGQAVLSIPFFAAGKLVSGFAGPAAGPYVQRFVVSLLPAFFTAGACLILFLFGKALGFRERTSFAVSAGYGLSTFAWPYAKYYTSESLLSFFFLSLFYFLYRAKKEGSSSLAFLAGLSAFFLILVKSATIALIIPASILALGPGTRKRAAGFFLPVLAAAILTLLYNYARFGSLFQSGYMKEATGSGFSTPLLVGLYGLLFSSGKSVFLYAPVLLLSVWGLGSFFRRERSLAAAVAATFLLNLILYAKFRAWAGDGSWGPRYLLPLVGPMLLPLFAVLEEGLPGRSVSFSKRIYAAVFILGLLIQVGGSSIYYGSYLREIGEYPYTREFADPRFLADSHFNPAFSPVAGHWKMLVENLKSIRRGDARLCAGLAGGETDRIQLGDEEKEELRAGVDYWFYYAFRFGIPGRIVAVMFIGVVLLAAAAFLLAVKRL